MVIIIGVVYSGFLFNLPKDVFWSPDEGNRLLIARSISPPGSQSSNLVYPGKWFDPDYIYYPNVFNSFHIQYPVPMKDGTVQYPWSLIFPGIAGILSAYLGPIGLYLLPLLSGLGVIVLSWLITREINAKISLFAIPIVGFATPVCFYSFTFWDHTFAVFLGLAALLSLIKKPAHHFLNPLIALILMGIAILIRMDMAIWGGVVGIGYVLILLLPQYAQRRKNQANIPFQKRNRLNWWYVGLVSMVILAGFGLFRMGLTPIPERYRSELNLFRNSIVQNGVPASLAGFGQGIIHNLPGLWINIKGEDGPSLDPGWNLIGMIALGLVFVAPWIQSQPLELACGVSGMLTLLGISFSTALSPEAYRSVHGIFLIAPLMPMASYTLPAALKANNRSLLFFALVSWAFLLGGSLVVLVLRSNSTGYWPGLEWGNRYQLILYPVLSILGLIGLDLYWNSNRPKWSRQIILGLGGLAIIMGMNMQQRGLRVLYEDKLAISAWQSYLVDHEEGPVVTDVWWLPASLATYFSSHELYSVPNEQNFLAWLRRAGNKGVARFTFVGQSGWDPNRLNTGQFRIQQLRSVFINGLLFTHYRLDLISTP